MDEISRQFRRQQPEIDIHTAYGSSGKFYAQIRNGAPFDLFLSADVQYPRKLVQDGIGKADSLFVYGVGRIAVWVPAQAGLDPSTALRAASVRHVAIANPQHAPYGRAAEAALRSMGLYDALAKKLVYGENIAQAFGFAESGAADVGIVALSLALAPEALKQGRYWEIPLDAYPPIEQGGVIVRDSEAARRFRSFLLGDPGKKILKRYGFYMAEKN